MNEIEIKNPKCADFDPQRLKSLREQIRSLLPTSQAKKKEWTERTDSLFDKLKALDKLEKISRLGPPYLNAYLLTKNARYANYQSELLHATNFTPESYLAIIAREVNSTEKHIAAYNQALDEFADKAIVLTSEALAEKDKIISTLRQQLANCSCQKEVSHE